MIFLFAINFLIVDHVSNIIYIFFCYLQAILNGLWVVFEDIDKAPADVQSILLPLLEGSNSFLTGHGEVLTFFCYKLIF